MRIECLQNTKNQCVDVIISTVPWTDSSLPLMAPATLKPIVEKVGMSCLAIDLNAEIYNKTLDHPDKTQLLEFFFDGNCNSAVTPWLEEMLTSVAEHMISWRPKFIGLSVFSYPNRSSCEWLCYYIKKLDPTVKIILGGAGCLEQFAGPGDFANNLIDRGLADYHVRGDGEHALYELLKGNVEFVGINSATWKELDRYDLAELPMPDYSNYNFSLYDYKAMPIQGSRGCVRQCTFCDYIENWKHFQWRTADAIFAEMKQQYQKYGIRTFKFQDTLINGNLKEFNKLITMLSEYNLANPDRSFKWGGFYIFRDRTNNDNWKTIADSGAHVLIVGIENINEDIRYAIGKKFSNASTTWHLEQAAKYGVRLRLLFITGYVNETQAHIDFAKSWLKQHVYLKDNMTIHWGGGLGIFPNTYLDRNKDQLGIQIIGPKPHMWINPTTGNTPKQRAIWVNELNQYSEELGYDVQLQVDNHFLLEQMLKS